MGVILLKSLLAEAKLYSYTIPEILDQFLKFEGKTLIFLDTETAGLEPNVSYLQLTQISAMVVDGNTMKVLGEFNKKIHLGAPLIRLLTNPDSHEAQNYKKHAEKYLLKYKRVEKTPSEMLRMTGYFNEGGEKMRESEALIELEQFIDGYHNVLLIIHNATFDWKAIQARRRKNGLPPMKRYPTLDTLKISRFFFIPALLSLENSPEATTMLNYLLAKTKFTSYSSSLGRLAKVLGVKMENWHEAKEDTVMLLQVLQKIIEFLKSHESVNIAGQQSIQAKRHRKI